MINITYQLDLHQNKKYTSNMNTYACFVYALITITLFLSIKFIFQLYNIENFETTETDTTTCMKHAMTYDIKPKNPERWKIAKHTIGTN